MINNLTIELKTYLERAKNPVLAWSGGKDSTFLLYFIKELGYEIPVLMFHHLWTKYQRVFVNSVIRQLNFPVYYYAPTKVNFDGHFVEMRFNIGGVSLPILMDYEYNEKHCGLDIGNKALQESYAQPSYPWDLTIAGVKRTDTHPLAPNGIDLEQLNNESHRFLTPLRDFSDEDVLRYSKKYNYPVDERVYIQNDVNADTGYFTACMNCVNSTGEVYCPKKKTNITIG